MPSLADQLALSRNRPAGFDYMRIALAASIIGLHSTNVTLGLGRALEIQSTLRIGVAMILALFFALSGFLVTASLLRCKSLISFLGLRVLRIGPALAVETTLSAIIIGSVFTELPLAQYVADPKFHAYFLNIVGDIHYELPGVFLHNPLPDLVNAQLWTVPYELWCYVILALLAVLTICFNRVAFLGVMVIAQIGLIGYDIYRWDEVPIQLRPHLLVFCFLAGVGFYLWRDKVPFNRTVCLLALVLCAAGMATGRGDALAPVPAAYVACYLGLMNPPRSWIVSSGDYSYGLYLYGFVIQQCVAAFGPPVQHWYLNLLISLPLAFGVAVASWHLVEKRALRLRAQVESLEAAVLSRISIVGFWRKSPEPAEREAVVQPGPINPVRPIVLSGR
ncbi:MULTISPECIES: acyltransferase family protein [Bradyrhizobium]|uniref:Peptidoglycan/LPS O-acetylase OafA/YrhL n=1 Tax=Bradyrhizobium elkanii TaxID=29448 RepID=A0A8I1Y647_BRAEL|nr:MULTISPECIES: acyltransferase [Bradyrhizobium]MBP1290823.1 peptidoglycan/LPS O-acetylase OafA/YrhL [Bradyrhizobium elkanii]MCP1928861.1 peptidoglycan/LPS O-acetylase OafA/YrhL [Bradyrhizobium elkanii]MCS3473817.1 peptidoglycan/LPS O-acetylase OafA/YrhL [Bradyrhizobium elkanii]MCS3580524.1 peptidoglycan/LPS O-acetylase OafA/YrhL [Bradyrhizobium elkanii]MCS3723400.1 peptidoglycan/LPS O-acetylase OafA/YrhL [Bradyrhizobium elkanii]